MDLSAGVIFGPIDLGRIDSVCPDQRCLLAIMEKHGPGLVQMLWRILGNQADVADAYQDTFCRLALLLQDGKTWNRKGFIFRLSANIAIDMLRRKRRDTLAREKLRLIAPSESDPACQVSEQDELDRLQAAIADLPEHLRQVLVLREFGDLDYAAIATTLKISVATARQYRHRAVLFLTDRLKEEEES